ncbi:hypothetical protein AB2M62_00305 [Sphingomonas sp. MMS12-HWE2-04]|uniref:hypothetical protein n=1 Tax=Sphingomonas sp. MMS12-HWE2-04 TaxID=3234199 RepID=UPI00384E0A84
MGFQSIVAALALLAPLAARADWHEASTRHFVVYSQDKPERLRDYAANLERFDMAVRKTRGWTDDPVGKAGRVTVYVLPSRGAIRTLSGSQNVAGFYIPRAGGSVAFVPRTSGAGMETDLDAQAILLHEYTHHLTWSVSSHGVLPSWFVEGFAELYATTEFTEDGAVVIGRPPQYRARTLMHGNALPVARMLTADTRKLGPEERSGLYARGWLLLHYLQVSGQRKGQLAAYIDALNAGKSSQEAAAAFGDLTALDRELERYKLTKFPAYSIASPDFAKVEVTLRDLTPGEAATMEVRIRSKRGRDQVHVFADAQKAAAPYPADARAQETLAEAAYYARDPSAAQAAADRAIAADPELADAYLYKAMARMALARAAKDRSPATWLEIRKIATRANKLDPDDPRALILYFRSFTEAGEAPTPLARQGLKHAFELAPFDSALRLNTARVYLHEGDKETARTILAPLVYNPHGGAIAERAAQLIALIDAGNAKAAEEAIGGEEDKGAPDGA